MAQRTRIVQVLEVAVDFGDQVAEGTLQLANSVDMLAFLREPVQAGLRPVGRFVVRFAGGGVW